jgi:hypothetical protein
MTGRTKYLDRAGGRIYFRINGKRQRLPDDERSAEFAAAYDALVAGRMAPKPRREIRQAPKRPAQSVGLSKNISPLTISSPAVAAIQSSRPARN